VETTNSVDHYEERRRLQWWMWTMHRAGGVPGRFLTDAAAEWHENNTERCQLFRGTQKMSSYDISSARGEESGAPTEYGVNETQPPAALNLGLVPLAHTLCLRERVPVPVFVRSSAL